MSHKRVVTNWDTIYRVCTRTKGRNVTEECSMLEVYSPQVLKAEQNSHDRQLKGIFMLSSTQTGKGPSLCAGQIESPCEE